MSADILPLTPITTPHEAEAYLLHCNRVLGSFPPARPEPQDAELRALHALSTLSGLLAEFGAVRVLAWVRNLAAINGESL